MHNNVPQTDLPRTIAALAIQSILDEKGIGFKDYYYDEIENDLLRQTGLPCLDSKETMKMSINSKNNAYFITRDNIITHIWFNQSVGYKLDKIAINAEALSEEEKGKLKNIHETKVSKAFFITPDLEKLLDSMFEESTTETEEQEVEEVQEEQKGLIDRFKTLINRVFKKG